MNKFAVIGICFILYNFFSVETSVYAQNMLGYSDPQGDFYVNDGGKIVHLEHQQISSVQFSANSITYVSNTGNL